MSDIKVKCTRCHFENLEGAKFCGECGEQLEVLCIFCQCSNSPQFELCVSCGHTLPHRTRAGEARNFTAGGERKQITVLFTDLSGYTAMTEKLDPEEVKEIVAQLFGKIAKTVMRYDGFIEKYVGDAILALFGVPSAHEDDPVRAIMAARDINEMVSSISPEYESRIGKPLAMHTGISTGLVVTGEVNLEHGTHGVLGDAVNLASRLSGIAVSGEIIVNQETWRQSEGYFSFEPLEAIKLRGKAQPTRAFKVLSLKGEPQKTRRPSGRRARLIGRTAEFGRLDAAMEDLRHGRGSIVSISGESGVGKSRLVEEFKSSIDPCDIIWRQGHCYAYAQNIPYFPFTDLLSRIWRIEESDTQEGIRQKIEFQI